MTDRASPGGPSTIGETAPSWGGSTGQGDRADDGVGATVRALEQAVWLYAVGVLSPAASMKQLGLYLPRAAGIEPPRPEGPGLGRYYCTRFPFPVVDAAGTATGTTAKATDTAQEAPGAAGDAAYKAGDPRRAELRALSRAHEQTFAPQSGPVLDETLALARTYLTPSSRVLAPHCRTRVVADHLAEAVPDGEVVATDGDAEVVEQAWAASRSRGYGNTAFVAADLLAMPAVLAAPFDLALFSIALEDYPALAEAVDALVGLLRPEGYLVAVGTEPEWLRRFGESLPPEARAAWPNFPAGTLKEYLEHPDIRLWRWQEILPGIDLAVAMKR